MTGRVRQALAYCSRREHLRRTVRIALVVGLVLTAINQADVIAGGRATAGTWLKCALNFVVPFIVSNLGLLTGRPSSFGDAHPFDVPPDGREAEPSRRRPGRSG